MLKQVAPGLFESGVTGARFDELSVEHDRDLEIRWLVDRQTGSVGLHVFRRPAAGQRSAAGVIDGGAQ